MYLKNIGQTNKSNKIAKSCQLSRYMRSRLNKINYTFVPSKKETKKTIFLQMLRTFSKKKLIQQTFKMKS